MLYCLLFAVPSLVFSGARGTGDPFLAFVKETVSGIPPAGEGAYVVPTQHDLDEWTRALNHFRAVRLDSCRAVLDRLGYTMTTLTDAVSGSTFDLFQEKKPIRKGWGTLVFNRSNLKRLAVHVNHPVDDAGVPVVAAELFRRSGARWMLIGGSARNAVPGSREADLALAPGSVFQRWHELIADLTQVALSMHGYNPAKYPFPVSASDVILSNGRTNDMQWGISQISLAFRDSLRVGGFHTALAGLDSGFASLAGGSNRQGLYSNDSAGFGHWMNVELSSRIRGDQQEYLRFIGIADRALSLTQKAVSRQINHAFGLVSPRVVKIDRANKLLFPPQDEKYRIVSFTPGQSKKDTLDLLFGNWLQSGSGGKARIVEYGDEGAAGGRRSVGGTVTKLVNGSPVKFTSGIRPVEHHPADSLHSSEEAEDTREPIQVHRIPLQPVMASTVEPAYMPAATPFHWGGILPEGFTPQVFTYAARESDISDIAMPGLSRYLIPLLRNSYQSGGLRFVGVDMTDMLVKEIARLVSEYRIEGQGIGLLAEQGENGNYYLRLFPETQLAELRSNLP